MVVFFFFFFFLRILSYMYVHPVPHQMIFHPEGQGPL